MRLKALSKMEYLLTPLNAVVIEYRLNNKMLILNIHQMNKSIVRAKPHNPACTQTGANAPKVSGAIFRDWLRAKIV